LTQGLDARLLLRQGRTDGVLSLLERRRGVAADIAADDLDVFTDVADIRAEPVQRLAMFDEIADHRDAAQVEDSGNDDDRHEGREPREKNPTNRDTMHPGAVL
jgi:hypothetical protein